MGDDSFQHDVGVGAAGAPTGQVRSWEFGEQTSGENRATFDLSQNLADLV